jgi:hypothetical protein
MKKSLDLIDSREMLKILEEILKGIEKSGEKGLGYKKFSWYFISFNAMKKLSVHENLK